MAARTRSSNAPARWAVVAGVLAAAVLPTAVAAAEWLGAYELLQAAFAIPVALVLGFGAIVLARRGRERLHRTVGRAGGAGAARVGKALGVLGVCLAVSASISIAFYLVLKNV